MLALLGTLALCSRLAAQDQLVWTAPVEAPSGATVNCGGIDTLHYTSGMPFLRGGGSAAFEVQGPPADRIVVRAWSPDGVVRWNQDRLAPDSPSAPATVEGVVVTPNRQAVVLIHANDDAVLWTFGADGTFLAETQLTLTVSGAAPSGYHMTAHGTSSLVRIAALTDGLFTPPFAGRSSVHCIAPVSGTTIWTHESPAVEWHDVAFLGEETFLVYQGTGGVTVDRVDAQGQLIYTSSGLPSGSSDLLHAATATSDGRFTFTSSFTRITQLDPSGAMLWSQNASDAWGYEHGAATTSGDVVLGGRGTGNRLTRFDISGNVVWDYTANAPIQRYVGLVADGDDGVVASAEATVSSVNSMVGAVEFVDAAGTRTALVDIEPRAGTPYALLPPHLDQFGNVWAASTLAVNSAVGDTGQVTKIVRGTDPTTVHCNLSNPNSTGAQSLLTTLGSPVASEDNLTLRGSQLPPGSTCLFLGSPDSGGPFMPGGSQGVLCLGGPIGRFNGSFQIQPASAAGTVSLQVLSSYLPTAGGGWPIDPGDKWYFQLWHRDLFAGQATSNFTNAVEIIFH